MDIKITTEEQLITTAVKPRVAAVVTLYNSEPNVMACIQTYINQVDILYIVDNSDKPDKQLIRQISENYVNINYIFNDGNKGVAYALNVAAQAAIDTGYDYLLTMDDDSRVPERMIETMLQFLVTYTGEIGIVAAQSEQERIHDSINSVWYTITSGNLLNLNAYKKCGPFLETLFIDWVDHEYCFRLKTFGYEIIEINYLILNHRLGKPKKSHLMGIILREWPSHNAVRMYYKMRNSLYVLRKYKAVLPWTIKKKFYRAMLTDLINILFFEDHKYHRLGLFIQAVLDYRTGQFGKLNRY